MLSGLLFLAASLIFSQKEQALTPEHLGRIISEDIQNRTLNFKHFKKDTQLLSTIIKGNFNQTSFKKLFKNQRFYFNIYDNNNLVYWNNSKIIIPYDSSCRAGLNNNTILGKSIFYTFCENIKIGNASYRLEAAIPIAWIFPFENQYLKSYWLASPLIPSSTEVSEIPIPGYIPINLKNQEKAFYVHFNIQDLHNAKPSIIVILLSLFGFICLLTGFFIFIRYQYTPILWGIFLFIFIISIRIYFYLNGLPFHLNNLQIFSPQLFASNKFLSSLGDLLINTILFCWLGILLIRRSTIGKDWPLQKLFLKYCLAGLFALGAASATFLFVSVLQRLILDSNISFVVGSFITIDGFTFIGLITISLMALGLSFFLYWSFIQIKILLKGKWLPEVFLIFASIIYFLANGKFPAVVDLAIIFSLIVLNLIASSYFKLKNKWAFSPEILLWGLIFWMGTTFLIQQFNEQKELENRKKISLALVQKRDPVTEYLFKDILKELPEDERLIDFLQLPDASLRNNLNDHLEVIYLKGSLNKYQAKIYIFDENKNPLFNPDTTDFIDLQYRIIRSESSEDGYLFFDKDAGGNHYYLARIPIIENENKNILGYLFIDLNLKNSDNESLYPELLQPKTITNNNNLESYLFGIYFEGNLISQSGDYPFPHRIPEDLFKSKGFLLKNTLSGTELWNHPDHQYTTMVYRKDQKTLDFISILSYLLAIFLGLTVIGLLFYFIIPGKKKNLIQRISLRQRIHYAMLSILLFSFIIIGLVTYRFSYNRYIESNQTKLYKYLKTVEVAVLQHLKNHQNEGNYFGLQQEGDQSEFKYFIYNLAAQQKIDINLFDRYGKLLASSQEDIYKKGLQARIMRRDVYETFYSKDFSQWFQKEKIGQLEYLSGYTVIRDEYGNPAGFINIPYFTAQKELNFQISNILIALINIYTFCFLISSLLALIITNNLTSSLNEILNKLKNLNLKKNELLSWDRDDEIGLFVKEYNKIIGKVEKQALLLAANEREMAWREMAKQVAHEIKNPLTPMKLNIQYLQKAIDENKPNIKQLIQKVTQSLIEQIDNLNYISTEFSDFAKLPEAVPKVLELNEMILQAKALFEHQDGITLSVHLPERNVKILADKNQILRVFSNLIHNAIQAIAEGDKGLIRIELTVELNLIKISIADNGKGISDEVKEKIFQPYFTTRSSGTGLGLAMTKKIIEFWNGKIWFEPNNEKGTIFHLEFPLIT